MPDDRPQVSDDGSVPEAILKLAWKLLWTPGTPYYLPDQLAHGASGGGHTVPAMAGVSVPDLGPFALFDKKPWGTVSIEMTDSSVAGLPTIQDGGFTFDPSTEVFTATVKFDALVYSGKYAVSGSGLAGCAVAGATGLLGALPPAPDAEMAGAAGDSYDDEQLELARQYRGQLVASDEGLALVSNYYEHNEALNEIVRGDTYFQKVWPTWETEGKTSRYYADQTTTAAQKPTTNGIGDQPYRLHALAMQVAVSKSAQSLYEKTGDDKYLNAATATTQFSSTVDDSGLDGETSVDKVMSAVAAGPENTGVALRSQGGRSGALSAEEQEVVRRVEEDYQAWRDGGNEDRSYSELVGLASESLGSGTFSDTFDVPSLTLTGTVSVEGSATAPQLTVDLTKASASIPSISIRLSTSLPHSLYQAVANALANAQFVADLIRKKVDAELTDPKVLAYFTDRINDALHKTLGAAPQDLS